MMKTEQTLREALIAVAIAQIKLAREDIKILETAGAESQQRRHYASPYNEEYENTRRCLRVNRGTVDLYQRVR